MAEILGRRRCVGAKAGVYIVSFTYVVPPRIAPSQVDIDVASLTFSFKDHK
jgi:hypothetical protein